jgi:uncharacterized protein (TIGR00270 family)
MTDCEVCGRSGASMQANIEGSELTVCKLCASLGKVISPEIPVVRPSLLKKPVRLPEEMQLTTRSDLSELVRKGREKLGLTQEQLTTKFKLPSNTIRRIEGGWQPPLDLMKRLEGVTKVSLVEGTGSTQELRKKLEKKALTIGDVVDVRT